ncbi:MAG: nicotinate (nicotinamide) nucleotide adenylyltransferase [Balneolaceae bacterium]|nr:nicotinate (nicotinamide) nucleotide adenylyltransferase [Balneolaceae bacterium]MDR9446146.1 nicotinate (nicotinamide) nucleotide adenylyltransferase [Balneolaceae bacterium]
MRTTIGLFGGAFDPIHLGHTAVVDSLLAHPELHEVWVLPTFHPSHRDKATIPFDDRVELCEAVFRDTPRVKVLALEKHLPPPSYTLKTLEFLQQEHPKSEFILCMGEDSAKSLHQWYGYDQIITNHRIFVAQRAESQPLDYHSDIRSRIEVIDHPIIDISSTQSRERIVMRKAIDEFLPEPVCTYLEEHPTLFH